MVGIYRGCDGELKGTIRLKMDDTGDLRCAMVLYLQWERAGLACPIINGASRECSNLRVPSKLLLARDGPGLEG